MNHTNLHLKLGFLLLLLFDALFALFKLTFEHRPLPIDGYSQAGLLPATDASGKLMIPNPPFPDYPDVYKEPNERLEALNLGRSNTVMCWPSVGGIIVAQSVQSVELDFIGLDRFVAVNRTYNATEEDIFCRKLRLIGGKWWASYWDFLSITEDPEERKRMTDEEKQVLNLGWPKDGGVWVLRLPNNNHFWNGFDRARNAHTMEERCKALEMSGATFFDDPRDCECVRPLLDGFGDDKPPRAPRSLYEEL